MRRALDQPRGHGRVAVSSAVGALSAPWRALSLAFSLLLLAACAPARHYEAALVLQDFAAGNADSRLKRTTPEPLRQAVSYTVAGHVHHADLYLPAALQGCERTAAKTTPAHCPRAALLAVPGAVPLGKDDPRLIAFATTLARAGFAVLAPELPGYRASRIRPSDAQDIAAAFDWLASRPQLAPQGRAGMFAFSYSVGPALIAALQDDMRDRVRFVVGVGGYHDLPRAMRFFTTGWFEHDGRWQRIPPDDTGKMVLVYSSLDYVANRSDRAVLDRMVALRRRNPDVDLAPLAARLSDAARDVYELAVNDDPAKFAELYARLPQRMRADIARLDLAQRDLGALQARLILVHGRRDNLIPWPESLALAAAAPAGHSRVFVIERALGHVELSVSDVLTRHFWREDLPDLMRLWRVIDLLLAERDADAGKGGAEMNKGLGRGQTLY